MIQCRTGLIEENWVFLWIKSSAPHWVAALALCFQGQHSLQTLLLNLPRHNSLSHLLWWASQPPCLFSAHLSPARRKDWLATEKECFSNPCCNMMALYLFHFDLHSRSLPLLLFFVVLSALTCFYFYMFSLPLVPVPMSYQQPCSFFMVVT